MSVVEYIRDPLGRFAPGNKPPQARKPPRVFPPDHKQRLNRGRYLRAKSRYTIMTFRLPKGDVVMLKYQAKRHNESIVERLRTYIVWGLEIDKKAPPF